jgi:hypothetical protein
MKVLARQTSEREALDRKRMLEYRGDMELTILVSHDRYQPTTLFECRLYSHEKGKVR